MHIIIIEVHHFRPQIEKLERVLLAYSIHNDKVGYTQVPLVCDIIVYITLTLVCTQTSTSSYTYTATNEGVEIWLM